MDIVNASALPWLATYIDGVTRFGVDLKSYHGVTTGAWRKVDHMLKNVRHVPVMRDREAMGRRLAECLARMEAAPADTSRPDAGYLRRLVKDLVPAAFRERFDV